MWQESREEVLGKSVHGNTLPVDNLTKAAEWTSWTRREDKKKIYAYFFFHKGFKARKNIKLRGKVVFTQLHILEKMSP